MPRWLSLSVHLRRRVGSLLFPTAGLSRHSPRRIVRRGASPRILYPEILRASLHCFVRASSRGHGQLARPTETGSILSTGIACSTLRHKFSPVTVSQIKNPAASHCFFLAWCLTDWAISAGFFVLAPFKGIE